MSQHHEPTDLESRVQQGTDSLSAITPETIEQRAYELARIEGRTEPNEADLEAAREDLTTLGQRVAAPEAADSDTEDLVTWDESPDATGVHAERVLPEDEINPSQTLMEEGMEEADHDQRVSAAEETEEDDEEE